MDRRLSLFYRQQTVILISAATETSRQTLPTFSHLQTHQQNGKKLKTSHSPRKISLRDTNPSCLTSLMMMNRHQLKARRHRNWHTMRKPIRTSFWKLLTHRKGRESCTFLTSIWTVWKRWYDSLRTSMELESPSAVLSGISSNITLTPTAKPSVRWYTKTGLRCLSVSNSFQAS